MNASITVRGGSASEHENPSLRHDSGPGATVSRSSAGLSFSALLENLIDVVAPCPWEAHSGRSPFHAGHIEPAARPPLYSAEERRRRDASGWTIVQAVLAPLQFLVFAASLGLVIRYLATGRGYEIATASILAKTLLLYTIMITGSIWEKEVFGQWLFARAFFWEDLFSMLVLGLQTAYLAALGFGWGSPSQQMMIAVAAYAAYAVNAAQFLLKLRAARLERRPTDADAGPAGRMA